MTLNDELTTKSRSLTIPVRHNPKGSRAPDNDSDDCDDWFRSIVGEGLHRRVGSATQRSHSGCICFLVGCCSRLFPGDDNDETLGAHASHVDDEAVAGSAAVLEAMLRDEATTADDHRERLVIHPGWTPKGPPILNTHGMSYYVDRRRGIGARFHAVARLRQRMYDPSWAGLTGR